jgi:hypothetical protein
MVVPCNLAEIYGRFGSTYCLHHQGDESPFSHGVTIQKTNISIDENVKFAQCESNWIGYLKSLMSLQTSLSGKLKKTL